MPRRAAQSCVLSRTDSSTIGAPCVLDLHHTARPIDERRPVKTSWEYPASVELAFGIVLVVLGVASTVFVGWLFVWAAIKDGRDNDALQRRIIRRRFP